MSFHSITSLGLERKPNQFNVVIMGSSEKQEKLLLDSFPIILENSNIRHKYLNRFDLSIKERIIFPKDFLISYYPEIIDKLKNIDILILTYIMTDKISFEYLKKFYDLYFNEMEEEDKPKSVIVLETDYSSNEEIIYEKNVDQELAKKLSNLFNGHFCDWEFDEEKFNQVLCKCLKNVLEKYNYIDDYSSFSYRDLKKEINSYILIYGDKSLQNEFSEKLFKSNLFQNYQKIKDNFFEIKYEKVFKDNEKVSFKIILKLVNNEYFYDSECNLILYDINNDKSYNLIKNLIRKLIETNGSKSKKIYELFAINNNPNSENENNDKIKKGKNLSYEIGANFTELNMNNDNIFEEKIKLKFDNILDQLINFINMSKNENIKDISNRKSSCFSNESFNRESISDLETNEKVSPMAFVREINNKIKNKLKNDKNILLNICKKCYSQLNIRINELSNIIIVYCEKCKSEPIGLSINKFLDFNKENEKYFYCQKCHNLFNYNFKEKEKDCNCNFETLEFMRKRCSSTKIVDNIPVPIFLKDCFCDEHNNKNNYYLKYSKIGLCSICFKEKGQNNYFIEKYDDENINILIEQKLAELKMEKNFIDIIQQKFDDCINDLKLKFEKLKELKLKMHFIKSNLIKTLQIIKNNSTIISNVKSLKFDFGQNWNYKEDESIEKRIKYLYNFFNYEADATNIYFEKNNNFFNDNIHINMQNNNFENDKGKVNVTDIWGLKNNEFICVSFNDGQAKVFDLKEPQNKNKGCKCLIKGFSQNLGINSLFVSKNENNIFKIDNSNKNEIIFLNGKEEIKIIQMNNDYSNYINLYNFKDESNNISYSIELDNNRIAYLNIKGQLKIASFYKNENLFKYNKKMVDFQIDFELKIASISRIKDNILCLDFTKNEDEDSQFQRNSRMLSDSILNEEKFFDNNNKSNKSNNTIEIKIISIGINNEEVSKGEDDNNNSIIVNEYTFSAKNYKLIGCLSEEKNLLLLNYFKDNKKNKNDIYFSIFDFSINQFIYTFKLNSKLIEPKIFIKIYFTKINDKQGFIILDKDLNIFQYFYDEQFVNKIYYFETVKIDENKNHQIYKMHSLIKNNNFI